MRHRQHFTSSSCHCPRGSQTGHVSDLVPFVFPPQMSSTLEPPVSSMISSPFVITSALFLRAFGKTLLTMALSWRSSSEYWALMAQLGLWQMTGGKLLEAFSEVPVAVFLVSAPARSCSVWPLLWLPAYLQLSTLGMTDMREWSGETHMWGGAVKWHCQIDPEMLRNKI